MAVLINLAVAVTELTIGEFPFLTFFLAKWVHEVLASNPGHSWKKKKKKNHLVSTVYTSAEVHLRKIVC